MLEPIREKYDTFMLNAQSVKLPEIELRHQPLIKTIGEKFVGFGSCFAQNLQRTMIPFGFNMWFNTDICAHYSTESMANIFEFIAGRKEPSEEDLLPLSDERVFLYRCFFKHFFHGPDSATTALTRMKGLVDEARRAVCDADSVVITLGTSWVLRLRFNNSVVCTAGGVPYTEWDMEFLSVEQNVQQLLRILEYIRETRGGKPTKVFFSVSPQRYLFGHFLRPGAPPEAGEALVDNFLSKATLRLAIEQAVRQCPAGIQAFYFPAFEIVYEEFRVFESLAHYDYTHIEQAHVPAGVVKRFLHSYASEEVLEQLVAYSHTRTDMDVLNRLRQGGLPDEVPQIASLARDMLGRLERFGDQLSPALIEHYLTLKDVLKQPIGGGHLPAFQYMTLQNRLSVARRLAAVDRADALAWIDATRSQPHSGGTAPLYAQEQETLRELADLRRTLL